MPVRIVRADWDEELALARAHEGIVEGVQGGAEVILGITDRVIPYESGMLAASGMIDVDEDGELASVYYDTVYAARLHQHPEYHFQGGRRGMYLKSTMNASKSRILEFFGKALKVKFSR